MSIDPIHLLAGPLLLVPGIQNFQVSALSPQEAEMYAGGQTPAYGIRGFLTTASGHVCQFRFWSTGSGIGGSFSGAGFTTHLPAFPPHIPNTMLLNFLRQVCPSWAVPVKSP